jgi:hypothetical protein
VAHDHDGVSVRRGIAVIVFSPRLGGRISEYNYGDKPSARRLTIIITALGGVALIAIGVQRLLSRT